MESSETSYPCCETSGSSNSIGTVAASDSSVAVESQDPADLSSDTESWSSPMHVPVHDYSDIITLYNCNQVSAWLDNAWMEEEAASGAAFGCKSGQESCDGGATTRDALGTTCQRSLQRLVLRLGEHSVSNLVATEMGITGNQHVKTTTEPLVLAQTEYETGFEVEVTLCLDEEDSTPQGWDTTVQMTILFDPNSDGIMLLNKTNHNEHQYIAIRRQPASLAEAPTKIESSEGAMLGPASYAISWSDKHILDMTVLPRGYISLDPQHRKPTMKSRKRPLERAASQSDPPLAKRPKTKETSDESIASTVVQMKPPINDVVAVSGPTASSSSRIMFNLITDLCHPLEELKLDGTIGVATFFEEYDYTLVRKADVSVRPNSLVFSAQHSDFPEKKVVVKLWRSHSGIDHEGGRGVSLKSVGKYWMNEVKNHRKVGNHRSIVSFYGYDARFLALYLEHIDVPSLNSFIENNNNPRCILTSSSAKRVLFDMIDAINFIHRKGIVHNDIKPSNILYSKERGAVLIDFGLATTGAVHDQGTRWYIPPEYAIRGTRGAPGDIFALGVVLLFLLRKIPLPELQSPPLAWPIRLYRGSDREAAKALDAMNRWKEIVVEAAKKLENMMDDDLHPRVLEVISRMVAVTADGRATGDKIVETVKEYDCLGRKYGFTYQNVEI
ncbi:kinase-like domain-containing protein [Trichoderma velutinum]